MKIFYNKEKYISSSIIEDCFEKGIYNVINKQVCGNGMTTAFLNLPTGFNSTDILIAPNKKVVIDKQKEYEKGSYGSLKIGFLYEGSRIDWYGVKYDKIVCVVDSFNNNSKDLRNRFKVRYILVDEQHTVEQSASFRKHAMYNLKINLKSYNNAAISTVTATPNQFATPTIKIENNIKETKVFISNNCNQTIDRLVDKVERGETILMFTQSAKLITKILNKAKRNDFNYVGGDSLKSKLCSKGEFVFNPLSNIIIVTSAGYEGWSCNIKNASAFMFTSFDSSHNAMLGSNIYQAIGRLREGSIHSEICIFNDRKTVKYYPNLREVVNHFVNLKSKVTTKQGAKYEFKFEGVRYKGCELKPFVNFTSDDNGIMSINIIEDSIDVHIEKYNASIGFEKTYSDFFSSRKVQLINIDEMTDTKLKGSNINEARKIEHLLFTLPDNLDLVELALYDSDSIRDLNHLKGILRVNIAVRTGLGLGCYTEVAALKLVSREDFSRLVLNLCIQDGILRKKYSEKVTREWFETSNIMDVSMGIIYEILKGKCKFNKVGFREFGKFTSVSNSLIALLTDELGLAFTELDIKTAYPKILFSMFGLDIPDDFYGADRSKNKVKVNTLLNNLHSKEFTYRDSRKKRGLTTSKKQVATHSYNKTKNDKKQLLKYFPIEIVDYLLTEFGGKNTDSSKFYHLMTFHEQRIINRVKQAIKYYNANEDDYFLVRKHDAMLIIHSKDLNFNQVLKTEYFNMNDWLKMTEYSQYNITPTLLEIAS